MAPDEPTPQWKTFALRMTLDKKCVILTFMNKDMRSTQSIRELESELGRMVPAMRSRRLIFDFSGMSNASSTLFGAVLRSATDARAKGVSVCACSMPPEMCKAFESIGAKTCVEIFGNVEQAIPATSEKRRGWWPF
jgi:anti-anti-sigma regulatory factor